MTLQATRKNLIGLVKLAHDSEQLPTAGGARCVVSYDVPEWDDERGIALLRVSKIDSEEFNAFGMFLEFDPRWDCLEAILERLESGRIFEGVGVEFDRVPNSWESVEGGPV